MIRGCEKKEMARRVGAATELERGTSEFLSFIIFNYWRVPPHRLWKSGADKGRGSEPGTPDQEIRRGAKTRDHWFKPTICPDPVDVSLIRRAPSPRRSDQKPCNCNSIPEGIRVLSLSTSLSVPFFRCTKAPDLLAPKTPITTPIVINSQRWERGGSFKGKVGERALAGNAWVWSEYRRWEKGWVWNDNRFGTIILDEI